MWCWKASLARGALLKCVENFVSKFWGIVRENEMETKGSMNPSQSEVLYRKVLASRAETNMFIYFFALLILARVFVNAKASVFVVGPTLLVASLSMGISVLFIPQSGKRSGSNVLRSLNRALFYIIVIGFTALGLHETSERRNSIFEVLVPLSSLWIVIVLLGALVTMKTEVPRWLFVFPVFEMTMVGSAVAYMMPVAGLVKLISYNALILAGALPVTLLLLPRLREVNIVESLEGMVCSAKFEQRSQVTSHQLFLACMLIVTAFTMCCL